MRKVANESANIDEAKQRLYEIVVEAHERDLDTKQLKARISQDASFSAITQVLPENKDQAYQFLALIIAILSFIVQIMPKQDTDTITPEQVEQIIERIVEDIEEHDAVVPSGPYLPDQLPPGPEAPIDKPIEPAEIKPFP